jgi:hypothetical protein
VASGLVLGAGLVLVEHALYWIFYFIDNRGDYTAGPALWLLVLGAAVVAAAGVVLLVRTPLGSRSPVRTDWRIACAFVVVACVLWFVVSGPEVYDGADWWVALYEGTFLLGGAALVVTLLWFDPAQRVAALVGITLFGLWPVYWIAREMRTSESGTEPSVLEAELIGVVLTLLACFLAQVGPARQPSATSTPSR